MLYMHQRQSKITTVKIKTQHTVKIQENWKFILEESENYNNDL